MFKAVWKQLHGRAVFSHYILGRNVTGILGWGIPRLGLPPKALGSRTLHHWTWTSRVLPKQATVRSQCGPISRLHPIVLHIAETLLLTLLGQFQINWLLVIHVGYWILLDVSQQVGHSMSPWYILGSPGGDHWDNCHQNTRHSVRDRPRSPYKLSAKFVQQFWRRWEPNRQTDTHTNSKLNITHYVSGDNKKLSCRRETARCFVSLNIPLSHSRSIKVIRNNTLEPSVKSLLVFRCDYDCTSYRF